MLTNAPCLVVKCFEIKLSLLCKQVGKQSCQVFFVAIATYMKATFFFSSFPCIGVLWDLHPTFLLVTWKFCKFLSFYK